MFNKFLQILTVLVVFASQASAQKYLEMISRGTFTVFQIQEEAEKHFAVIGKGKGTGHKQFKRWEYNAMREMDEDGNLPNPYSYYEEHQRFQRAYREKNRTLGRETQRSTGNWAELGPTYWNQTSGWNPGVGRITSFAIDPANNDHIIAGANTGGVWKTTNRGQSWSPLADEFTTMVVSALTMDPQNSNIYYWGTSYGNVYKSIDAGANWTKIGNAGSSTVNKIIIHPTNSNILFATSDYSGIYKSTNGGISWTKVSASSRGYDIVFKPGDPNTVYAAGTSFYKSTDGGNTFTQTTTGSGVQMIGVSAAAPNRVYVVMANGGQFGAFYKSTNSGASFTQLDHTGKNYFGYSTTASDDRGQAPRDMAIAVNPTNADEVHIAGILTWRSTNAGTSFSATSDWVPGNASYKNIGYCHADVDIMQYVGTKLYVGSDGGLFVAENTANVNTNYYTDLTAGMGIRQFYKIGVSRDDQTDIVVTGGSQDNGTSVMKGADAGWYDWLGADGMETFVDWSNPNNLYGTSQFGSLYKSTNGGQSYSGVSKPISGSGNWVTPLEQDPQVATTIYTGYEKVYKSENWGSTWTAISQDFGGNLNHLKIAESDNKVMYASRGSYLYKTTTGNGTWSLVTSSFGSINYISIHPTNPNKVAIATNSSNRVYVSTNGGTTWTSYLKNLPAMTAYCVLWDADKDGLYVGMNYGIYYINSELTEWEPFMTGIPNVKVNELEIFNGKIYAGTYGRGLWVSDVYSSGPALTHDVEVVSVTNLPAENCGTQLSPTIQIKNLGTEILTTINLKVLVNGSVATTINHTTSLIKGQTEDITFDITLPAGNNIVKVESENPNGQVDQNTTNDSQQLFSTITDGSIYEFYISDRSKGNNLSWVLVDEQSQIIESGNANTTTLNGDLAIQEMCLATTCYELQVTDPFTAGGGCTTPAWVSGTEYCGGSQVSHNGLVYTSDWCTTSEPGTGQWIGWTETGTCSGTSYDNDVLGIKKQGDITSEVEVTMANFIAPFSETFGMCNQNQFPTISILAPNESSLIVNSIGFDFKVNVQDADGSVTKVDYEFTGENYSQIVTSTIAPFTVEWGFTEIGTYQVQATATDNDGNSTSVTKSFEVVNGAPELTILTPANNATLYKDQSNLFTVNASDIDGTVTTVDYFFRDGGEPTIFHSTQAPFSLDYVPTQTFTNLQVDVVAIDNDNRGTWKTIYINVVENQLPTVSITSPTSGSSFEEGVVTFTVDAQDTDGSITKVELYASPNTLLATSTSAPYTFDLDLTEGNYGIFAKAYDNIGDNIESSIVGIEITESTNTCSLSEWNSNGTYYGGDEVQYQGVSYKANWWTQANPASNNGSTGSGQPWTISSTCMQRVAYVQEELEFVAMPNPFTESTEFAFTVTQDSYVELAIYNLQGEKVATLENIQLSKGIYSYVWSTEVSGSYLVKLVIGDQLKSKLIIKQ